jgi:hypothetical protein
MSAANDRIKALLLAKKAGQAPVLTESQPAPKHDAPPFDTTPKAVAQPAPTHTDKREAGGVDPFAGLTGTALVLAKMKAAKGKSEGVHSGNVTGQAKSVATETTTPATPEHIVQRVLTPAERQLQAAKQLMQQREEAGFYDIKEGDCLPEELPADVVSNKLRELDAAMELRTPQLANLMIDINRNLRQYDELAYLLTDDQLGLIVRSNLAVKNIELSAASTKKTSAVTTAAKLAKSVTVDDL